MKPKSSSSAVAPAPGLSRQHRAWVALYALQNCPQSRADILQANQVTDADLEEFHDSWLKLRRRTADANP